MVKPSLTLSTLTLLVISLVWSSNASAQYYRLFDKDRTMTFARLDNEGFDSLYYFMKVDRFELEGSDTVYFFNTQLEYIGDDFCTYKTDDTVLLGYKAKILSDEDTSYVFFNKHEDSIFIKTQVDVGNTWRVYTWPDGNWIKATAINKLQRTVFPEIEDTLLRIQLNVFDIDGTMLTDVFPNATKIDVSRNYGITEFFDFYNFPEPGDSIARVLRGLSNPNIAIVDVNAQTAFDYQTGYEFHYREEIAPDELNDADKHISAWKYFVLDKTQLPDGVTYTMERILFDTLYTDGVPTSTITWDTVEVTYMYADYAFLDTLEFTVLEQEAFGYADWVKNDTLFKGLAHKYVYDWYAYDAGTLCLFDPDVNGQPEQLYGHGLGLIHFGDSTAIDDYYAFDMTYFHVGLLEWGTPYDFSDLDLPVAQIMQESSLQIWPNPTKDYIHLHIPSGDISNITVFNQWGQQIIQSQSCVGLNTIYVEALPAGIYYLMLTGNKTIQTGTFIKQ